MKLDERIYIMAEPIVADFGYELVDAEYIKEGQDMYLRLYIDKPGGVNIEDCQKVSEKFGQLLDETDIIKDAYIFEVSSPGLERVLKKDREFARYSGELIELKFYAPNKGRKSVQGKLLSFDSGNLYLEVEGSNEAFDRKDVALAKRVYIF